MRCMDILHKINTQNGVFLLNGIIDDAAAYKLMKEILDYSTKYPNNRIVIYICSEGGSVTSGMAIYDVMRYVSNPISTIAVEKAVGISALILATGARGMRYAYSDTEIRFEGFWVSKKEDEAPKPSLDEEPRNASWRNKKTDNILAEVYEAVEKICNIMAKLTGKNVSEVKELLWEEGVLNVDDALKWGLIDKIVSPAVNI